MVGALVVLLAVLAAGPADCPPGTPVHSVRVDGLRRTRRVVVDQFVRARAGEPLGAFDAEKTRSALLSLGIFSDVQVRVACAAGGAEIALVIDEKWTLYPIPTIVYWRETQILGLVLAESNAFGFNKGWAAGGVYTNRGWYALAAYSDPNIAFTDAYGKLSAYYGDGQLRSSLPDGRVIEEVQLARLDLQYALGYTILPHFSPTLTGALRRGDVSPHGPLPLRPFASGSVVSQGLDLVYSTLRVRDYFDEGLRLTIEYQHGFQISGDDVSYDQVTSDNSLTVGLWPGHNAQLEISAAVARLPPIFERRLGGLDGSRTLPASLIAADAYANVSARYQFPIFRHRHGILTGLTLLEGGAYSQGGEPTRPYAGPGLGLRINLTNIAIPAFGADLAWNPISNTAQVSIAIGYRPAR
jgi:hypothetical protein